MILYHGTTTTRSESILENGFDLGCAGDKSGYPMPGVSMTISQEIAIEHAEWAAEKFNASPSVIQVDVCNLKIMAGSELYDLAEDLNEALQACNALGYDGAELFDVKREIGEEEFEVLIFRSDKLQPTISGSSKQFTP